MTIGGEVSLRPPSSVEHQIPIEANLVTSTTTTDPFPC